MASRNSNSKIPPPIPKHHPFSSPYNVINVHVHEDSDANVTKKEERIDPPTISVNADELFNNVDNTLENKAKDLDPANNVRLSYDTLEELHRKAFNEYVVYTQSTGQIKRSGSIEINQRSDPKYVFSNIEKGSIIKRTFNNALGNEITAYYEIIDMGAPASLTVRGRNLKTSDNSVFNICDRCWLSSASDYRNYKEIKQPIKDLSASIESPVLRYMDNNFSNPKNEIYINRHIIKQGVYNGNNFVTYNKNKEYVDSFNFIKKTNEDILIYIPVDWANHSGYDLKFIQEYIDVLNSFELSNIKYLGKSSYENFKGILTNRNENYLINDDFYLLHISGESETMNFVILKLLSYLYECDINNMPGLFMQLRNKLAKQQLNDWQVLLYTFIFAKSYNIIYKLQSFHIDHDSAYLSIPNIFSPKNTIESLMPLVNTSIFSNIVSIMCNSKIFDKYFNTSIDYKNIEGQFLNYKSFII